MISSPFYSKVFRGLAGRRCCNFYHHRHRHHHLTTTAKIISATNCQTTAQQLQKRQTFTTWNTQPQRIQNLNTSHRHLNIGINPFSQKQKQKQHDPKKSSSLGLYSLEGLHLPSDFLQLSQKAMKECDALRSHLSSITTSSTTTNPHPVDLLHDLDDISNIVCSVIDAAELCRSTHVSPTWRNAANESFRILSDYISQLNSDVSLYHALQLVVDSSDDNNLTAEQVRMAYSLKAEFERDGIHLPSQQRDHVRMLSNRVVSLETLFMEHITKGDGGTRHVLLNKDDVTSVIPPQYLPPPSSSSSSSDGNKIAISTDEANLLNTLLRHSSNPNVRKEVFMEYNTSIPSNLDTLHALIQARHELATTLNFTCYAERFLQDKMVGGDSTKVLQFLQNLLQRGENMYRKEMEMMLQVKKHIEGGVGTSDCSKVEAWDVPFYTHVITSHQAGQHVDLSNLQFKLENVVQQGMKTLVEKLFGIQMVEVEMSPYERWDLLSDEEEQLNGGAQHPSSSSGGGVRKFDFHHEEEGPLGTMYLDLHPRPGKYVHAAHFTIRCGCKPRPTTHDEKKKQTHQLPIVALVCNLASNNNGSNNSDAILSHGEVETLLHEFGHALHSLLSRTSFQHLSGTRAPIDFVETPSHFMEQFAWEPQFLRLVSSSGSTLDENTIATLISTRFAFRGVNVRTQILYALFDQGLFGTSYPHHQKQGGGDPTTYYSTQLFESLHQQYSVPYARGTHWHTRFGHLVTYGAGYYGYLYSQVFAFDIWKTRFAANANDSDVMSRREGTRLWKDMLFYGGGKDPNEMLRDVLGREPSVDAFFEGVQ